MKRIALLLCLLVAVVASGCCRPLPLVLRGTGIVGSGRPVTREMDLSGFTRVQAGSAFTVDIKQGDGFYVAVTADDNLFERLNVSVSGDTLRLQLRPGLNVSRATLRAEVTMPSLRGLDLSGASHCTLAGFKSAESLRLDLSGASSLQGGIEAGNVRLQASGASDVELTGAGGNLSGSSSGASTIRLTDFAVKDADLSLSGASRAYINARGRLDADVSGASRVEYSGGPTIGRLQTTGGSSISAR